MQIGEGKIGEGITVDPSEEFPMCRERHEKVSGTAVGPLKWKLEPPLERRCMMSD